MTATRYELDAYVLDTLMRDLVGHDHRPSAFLVYLAIVAAAAQGRAIFSHAELAERTGLSRRATQDAVRHLAGRGLLRRRVGGPTERSEYEPMAPWRRGEA